MDPKRSHKGTFLYLLLLYVASFLVHVILNIAVTGGPTVVIDEGLYTNIARSIAWEGKIAFRSQPVDYISIFYPLLLVPVYRLNWLLGGDIYRVIQVFNTLLITSSVIPAFLFALDVTKDRRKAFWTALLVSLMPDMVMGGYLMTESVLWPMALWLLYFAYRWYTREQNLYGLLTALFTGLMFFTKPGAVAFGAVLILVRTVLMLRGKQRDMRGALMPILLLLLMIAGIYALYVFGFGQDMSVLGLYDKQTSEWQPKDILVALEATFLTVFLFVFACGGIFALFPLLFLKEYEPKDRTFIRACYLGILAVIIGTAVFVVPFRWGHRLGQLPLHLRYASMFIPAFFVFALTIEQNDRQMRSRIRTVRAVLIVFAVLCMFPGVRSGFVYNSSFKSNPIDSLVLSAFCTTTRLNGRAAGLLATFLMLIFCAYLLVEAGKGWKGSLQKNAALFLMAFTVFNAVCAHINAAIPIDPGIGKDANEVRERIGAETALGISQRFYDDIYSYMLDAHLNRPMQQVTVEQMFLKMNESKGVYSPFIPEAQSPNLNNHETPDTDLFVLGMTIAEHLELRPGVQAFPTENGHFTVARITKGERWLDSMLYGMDDNMLAESHPGILDIYDGGTSNLDGQLHLTVTASGSGTLSIGSETVQLTPEKTDYELVLQWSTSYAVRAENGDAALYSYGIRR